MTGARVNVIELVAAHLADPASGWSIGASGVLAEFMRDPGEPCERDGFQLVTARGAIRVAPSADLHALAYEVLSAQPGLWHHGVLLSLPAAAAALPMRTVVTELGPVRYDLAAAGFGCHAEDVRCAADIVPAIERAFASGRPSCINVHTDPAVIAPITIAMVGRAGAQATPGKVAMPYYGEREVV